MSLLARPPPRKVGARFQCESEGELIRTATEGSHFVEHVECIEGERALQIAPDECIAQVGSPPFWGH